MLQTLLFVGISSTTTAQQYSLGEWTVAGSLNTATTQFYGAVDHDTSTAYITGGLISDTQAKNLVESIGFDINGEELSMLSASTCIHTDTHIKYTVPLSM